MDHRRQKSTKYFQPSTLGIYGTMLVLLAVVAVWLGFDLAEGRSRIIAERSSFAVQKSQFMSQWFGTTIISADYVLRDILDKVTPEEVNEPDVELLNSTRLTFWLAEKRSTVPGFMGVPYTTGIVFSGWRRTRPRSISKAIWPSAWTPRSNPKARPTFNTFL